jgi:hypothetical protein
MTRLFKQWMLYLSVVALLLASSSPLRASIVVPDGLLLSCDNPLNIEQLLADCDSVSDTKAIASSKASSHRTTSPQMGDFFSDVLLIDFDRLGEALSSLSLSPGGGSTSGSTTTSSSIGGTNTFPLDAFDTVTISDSDLVRWVSGEQHLLLPMPPGTDLLRPPQVT